VSLIKQPQCKKQATLTNEKLLQPVLDALPDGVYITDGNGVTVTINKAYERITGLQRLRVVLQTYAGFSLGGVYF
jgi:PAS domain-containing protein